MSVTYWFILLFASFTNFTCVIAGEQGVPNTGSTNDIFKQFRWQPSSEAKSNIASAVEPQFNWDLYKAQTDYDLFSYEHVKRVLLWQFTSSVIIFWMVLFIVFIGLVFSGIQFYFAFATLPSKKRSSKKAFSEAGTEHAATNLETEVDASIDGLKVKSPVLGVVILVLSIVFFYLYLKTVYPITFIDANQTRAVATPASGNGSE